MKKRKVLKRIVIIVCILVFPVTGWIMSTIENNKPEVLEHYKHVKFDTQMGLTLQDTMLFDIHKVKLLTLFIYWTSDLRNDVRSISLSNNMGFIDYTSIDIDRDFNLEELVLEPRRKIPKIKSRKGGIMTRLSQGGIADSVILSYAGDADRLTEFRHSDNFRSYTVYAKTLSVRYGENEPQDISINQVVNQYRPFSFAFLKKDSLLFFIVYGPNVEKIPVEEALKHDYLGEFVKWQE